MRKFIVIILFLAMLFMVTACDSTKETAENTEATEATETSEVSETSEVAETSESTNTTDSFQTITFPSEEELVITADVYPCEDSNNWIVGFHQSGSSRGEYRDIAPKLVELGYNVLAVDLRSGKEVINVVNETNVSAKALGLTGKRDNDYQDVLSAINYAEDTYQPETMIVMGSSYSAAMSLIVGAEHDAIDAIVAFSPAEYAFINGKSVADNVVGLKKPVFITSAKNETDDWQRIAEGIESENKVFDFPPVAGVHGIRSLWHTIKGNEHYWEVLTAFLESL